MSEYDTIVLSLDIDYDREKLQESATAFILAERLVEQVMVTVDGYDNDPRELWEIPEVMAYLREWYAHALAGGATFTRLDDISRALLLLAIGMGRVRQMPEGDYRFEMLGNL